MGTFRLSSLTLEGFKSFAGRAELTFPAPLTAIVGPNGAGKSNICDAVAWVLGEQSARLLRSQTMADVVFAGATQRPPAGSAEVTLTLSASDGRWVDHDGRLEISRRVLRDGSSEYRMGGRRARLKDIADQLMDAGLGTRAYAIIEQGRIGQVLSARSTDRRALFEEAAGITKFRVRRHEAELKLAETRANLVRLDDVASEVRRALEAARRQARRAERHRALRGELNEVRGVLLAARRIDLETQAASCHDRLRMAEEGESAAAGALARAEVALGEDRTALDAAQEELAALRTEEARLDAAAQRREAEEVAARRELEDAAARRERAGDEARRLRAAADETEGRGESLDAACAEAERAAAGAEAAANAALTTASVHDADAARAGSALEEARRALLTAAAAANEARNRLHRLEVGAEQTTYQRQRVLAEQERLAAHLRQVAEREGHAEAHQAEAVAATAAIERGLAEVREKLAAVESRAAATAQERDRAAHERWQARHELEGLERALASSRALPNVLTRLVPDEKLLGTVSDFLEPEGELAGALDAAYGSLLTLPVLAGHEPLEALRRRPAGEEGAIEVVVADRGASPRPSPLLELAGAAPEDLGWLTRSLPAAAVAASDEEADRLAADPDLVVVLPGGGRRLGNRIELPGTHKAAEGVLVLRGRARRAAAREAASGAEESRLATLLEGLRGEVGELSTLRESTEAAAREAASRVAAAASAHETVHREPARLERELEALASELGRLASEQESAAERLTQARSEVERLAERSGELEGAVDLAAAATDRRREEAAAARALAERARGEAALAAERSQAARRERDHHRRELASLRERERAARIEEKAQGERAESATAAVAAARSDLEGLLASRETATTRTREGHERTEALRERVREASADAERQRASHLAARDAAHAARLAVSEAQAALEKLEETIALTLGADAALPETVPEAEALAGLREREADLGRELEALGPVNELAVTERDELEQRHTFLRDQRRDLERALASLGETIRELDATCAERFLATLQETGVAFARVFHELFGGGEASVELADPESPLESGVEIRVRPPGKHNQSVLLLSGGEKALAAVALLLALFHIRPAPFCVLDEVDAPLDDANVERLCRLLRQMSEETQFLLVTHNRRTMAHADVLYGVTMEEPGVSRIVSVRLE